MSHPTEAIFAFVTEAKTQLASATAGWQSLENAAPDSVRYTVDRLWRLVQSLHGGASFLGFTTVARLSEALQRRIEPLRQGDSLGPALRDDVLSGIDRLASLLDDIERSNDADITAALQRLQAEAHAVVRVPPTLASLQPEFREALRLMPAHPRRFLYLIDADLAQLHHARNLTPVELARRLQQHGEVLEARLEVAEHDLEAGLPTGPVRYQALYASALERDALIHALQLPAEAVGRITPTEEDPPVGGPASVVKSVSEPRSPGSDMIRIPVGLLDRLMTLAGELVLVRNQALLAVPPSDPAARRIVQRLNSVTSELQDVVMRTRLQSVGNLFNRFPRLVRDLARQLDKQIELTLEGNEVELDKTILEALADPLTHLIRNGCDHGIEGPAERSRLGKSPQGRLHLHARHEGSQISITLSDDGRGIDPDRLRRKAVQIGRLSESEANRLSDAEALELILLPGFSTAERLTDVSGRGVGMDVVRTNVEQFGGALEIDSVLGQGTTFRLRLPLTVAIIPCLIVVHGQDRYAIPQKDLEELVCLHPDQLARIELAHDQEVYRLRDRLLPLVRLRDVFSTRRSPRKALASAERPTNNASTGPTFFAVVKAGNRRYGLVVDHILTTEEVVVKPLHPALKSLRCFSAATIMGDGRVALILDTEGIARLAAVGDLPTPTASSRQLTAVASQSERQTALLFRSGPDEQLAMPLAMIRRIEPITAHRIERVGDRELVTINGQATSVLRLDRVIKVSAAVLSERMGLLIPRNAPKPVGILATSILDTVELPETLSTEACCEAGILGTTTIHQRLTLVLDIFALMDRFDPKPSSALLVGRPRRILLVEDTPFFRELVGGYLRGAGHQVTTATNGAEGLALLDSQVFDLIVSDIEMPVMNGWEFARSVRHRPHGARVPMVALTTLSGEGHRAKARECGFDRYEVKVDRERLLATINELLTQTPDPGHQSGL